jgi:NADH dehydrogenase FAD-containing subunit
MPAKKIIIVGGGNAGLSVAAQLLQKDKNLQISIIDHLRSIITNLHGHWLEQVYLIIIKQ